MKKITINGKEYEIDCNAFTQVQYQRFFKTGILKDMKFIKEYLIKQSYVTEKLKLKIQDEAQLLSEVSDCMANDLDDFIIKITQIAWILIYSADNKVDDYETWMKSMKRFDVSDEWIAEVTETAVECFC